MKNVISLRRSRPLVLALVAAAFSSAVDQGDAAALPCDPSREQCTNGGPNRDPLGTVLIDAPHSATVDQGASVSVKPSGFRAAPGHAIDASKVHVTFEYAHVPSWATASGETITLSPTAPAGASATIGVTATGKIGTQVVATGAADVAITVKGVNRLDLKASGGTAEGQERVFFTPCGSPAERVNLLIGAGVEGPLKIEVRDMPAGVLAQAPSSVDIAGKTLVPIELRFHSNLAHGADGKLSVVVTPAKGSASTLRIAYKIAPGHITDVSPNLPETPRFMHAGDTVTLKGQGFCAGAKVTVGNASAVVDGKDLDAGLKLQFTMPATATSGDVTVQTSQGTFSTQMAVDSYRNRDGFSFSNSSAFQDMVGGYNVTDFPWSYSVWEVIAGLPLVYLGIADAALESGQCFGFSLTSLRFQAGEFSTFAYPGWDGKDPSASGRATDVWRLSGPLLSRGGSNVPKLAETIHKQHLWQMEGHVLNQLIDQSPTHDSLRASLRAAFSEGPGAVVSVFDWGSMEGHAVVAYDVRETSDAGPGGYEIDLYDPNVPFSNGATQSILGRDEDGANGATHVTALRQSRILVKSDDTYVLEDGHGAHFSGSTKHLTVLSMRTFDQEAETPDTGLLTEIFGAASGARVTQVTDDTGKTLFRADGTPNLDPATKIPRGRAILPMGGAGNRVDPWFVVDARASYTMTLANGAASTYSAAAVANGLVLDLSRTPSQNGATDSVRIDPKSGSAEVWSSVPKSLAPRLLARLGDKTWRWATVHASLAAGAHGRVAFDSQRGAFTYTHDGASGNVSFDLGWSKRQGATVTSAPVQLDRGDTVTIRPDWDHVETGAGELRVRKAGGAETVRKIR